MINVVSFVFDFSFLRLQESKTVVLKLLIPQVR